MEQHGPIPASPDFPVVWDDPDDERLFWTRDAMHFPNSVNVLEDEFLRAFERRWPTTLRPIVEKELRNEVYFSIRPSVIAQVKSIGRYQSIRLVVEPRAYRLPLDGGFVQPPSSSARLAPDT